MGASPIHWVSFLGYHFNLIGWKVWTGKCSLVKGVSKQPLLLLSSMLSREKQATPRFLPAAVLVLSIHNFLTSFDPLPLVYVLCTQPLWLYEGSQLSICTNHTDGNTLNLQQEKDIQIFWITSYLQATWYLQVLPVQARYLQAACHNNTSQYHSKSLLLICTQSQADFRRFHICPGFLHRTKQNEYRNRQSSQKVEFLQEGENTIKALFWPILQPFIT
jgi:hypothetical protein